MATSASVWLGERKASSFRSRPSSLTEPRGFPATASRVAHGPRFATRIGSAGAARGAARNHPKTQRYRTQRVCRPRAPTWGTRIRRLGLCYARASHISMTVQGRPRLTRHGLAEALVYFTMFERARGRLGIPGLSASGPIGEMLEFSGVAPEKLAHGIALRLTILRKRRLNGGESGIRTHGTSRYTRFPSGNRP